MRKEQRLPRVQHAPSGMIAVRQDVLEGLGKPRLRGIGVDDFLATEPIRLLQDVDDAAIAQKSNRQLRNALGGCGVIQRRLQRLTHPCEKLLFLEVPLLDGNVVTDDQVADRVPLGVVPPRDREPREELRSVFTAAAKQTGRMAVRMPRWWSSATAPDRTSSGSCNMSLDCPRTSLAS